jgi:hypothetical protein
VIAFSGFTGLAHAQSDPTAVEFPMIGVGFNQTFQLNVVSFNPCLVQLAILDANGMTLGVQSGGGSDQIGRVKVRFPFFPEVPAFPQRKELRATVSLQPTTTSPCQAQATAEVFDNFSRTDWVLTPGLIPPGPNTMPIYLGPVGLIFEQTARLNVVAHPPNPCIGTIGFTDTSGNPIGSPMPVSLAPNQATFIDLTGLQAGIALGSGRPEVIGVFTPSPATAPGVCIPSVEVFDQLSGYTRNLILIGLLR